MALVLWKSARIELDPKRMSRGKGRTGAASQLSPCGLNKMQQMAPDIGRCSGKKPKEGFFETDRLFMPSSHI